MTCDRYKTKEGLSITLCSRSSRRRRCGVPGCHEPACFECDYPLRGRAAGRTCDRALCVRHATRMRQTEDGTIDYCPPHAAEARGAAAQEVRS